jgi:hypothetical protein
VVMMAMQSGGTQVFTTTGSEFLQYKRGWLERVENYYRNMASNGNIR